LVWGDEVLGRLPARAKAFFSAGRFLEVTDDGAVFALPNAPHVDRASASRSEVEAVLAERFGRPVPLRLVVDPGGPGQADPSRPANADPPPAAPDPSDDIDLSELTDATDVAQNSVDRVRELFPGAELVDEG
jgi:hypothetical protein